MSDPKRLLNDPATAKHVSALLRQLPVPAPPSPAKEAELTRALMAPPAPIPTGFAGTAWVAGGAALALFIAGAWLALGGEAPPTTTTSGAAVVRTPTAVAPAVEPPPPRPEAAPPAASLAQPARSAPRRAVPVDTLAAEAQLLEEARRSLVRSPGTALALLRQHQARFPSGQLGAERLYLTVQALERSGDVAAASRQGELLLQKFPRSVYAAQLREKASARKKD